MKNTGGTANRKMKLLRKMLNAMQLEDDLKGPVFNYADSWQKLFYLLEDLLPDIFEVSQYWSAPLSGLMSVIPKKRLEIWVKENKPAVVYTSDHPGARNGRLIHTGV